MCSKWWRAVTRGKGKDMTVIESTVDVNHLLTLMPKAELHLHLDGSIRPETIGELAETQGISLPVPRERLAEACIAPAYCRDLMEVLSYFALPLRVLQTDAALERVTYELCETVRQENVRYVEIRFAPSLHREQGMSLTEVIAAVVRGWDAGRMAFGLAGGIILCAVRQMPPEASQEVAEAGVPFLGKGVVAFDLAGDEARFSVLLHREPLLWAKSAGYGMTVHAGEAAGAQSVRDAVEAIGVSRIGHGTRSEEDPSLLPLLRDRHITLDMCPTSNVHVRTVPDLSSLPLGRYYHFGIPVSINSDNMTVSNTNVQRELELTHEHLGLSVTDLAKITLMAVEAGFAEERSRRALLSEFREEMKGIGIL
jgi:adenosine deaminase